MGNGINAAWPRMKIQLWPHASGLPSCPRTWAAPHLSSTETGATKAPVLDIGSRRLMLLTGAPSRISRGRQECFVSPGSGRRLLVLVTLLLTSLTEGQAPSEGSSAFIFGSCCLILICLLQISTVFILCPCF